MLCYQMQIKDIFTKLDTSEDGLSDEEVKKRLDKYGLNTISSEKGVSALQIFLIQFKNPLIVILILGVILAAYSGHTIDAVAISVIILINIMIGFVQEINMRKSMDALKNMAAPLAQAKREGEWREVPADSLVVGDIVKLLTGSRVQADMRSLNCVYFIRTFGTWHRVTYYSAYCDGCLYRSFTDIDSFRFERDF
jgi:Ca2+-transporting ATPase